MLNWKHLQEVDETYFEHMFYAFKIIYKFTRLIGCMLTHAIFPFIFCNALEPTMRRVQQDVNERVQIPQTRHPVVLLPVRLCRPLRQGLAAVSVH